uniref:Uncharacterized protein n=1 Tax=mine drainage metagenome TaxID=410659 RepID=E6QHF0_9ZZZZ
MSFFRRIPCAGASQLPPDAPSRIRPAKGRKKHASEAFDEGNRFGRDAFPPPCEPEVLGGLGLDVDGLPTQPEVRCDPLDHERNMGRHFRRLGHDRRVDVHDPVARFGEETAYFPQDDPAVDVLELLVGVGKMPADVAQCRCADQRVANRMQQHVRIGVAHEPLPEGNLHAADDQLAPRNERMHVESLPYSHVLFLSAKIIAAIAMSAG